MEIHNNNNRSCTRMSRQLRGAALIRLKDFNCASVKLFSLQPIDQRCDYCGAYLMLIEKQHFPSICCRRGKVVLEPIHVNSKLQELLQDQTSCKGQHFHRNIRKFNQLFAFTSLGVKYDKVLMQMTQGSYTFRIQGQLYHYIGPLTVDDDREPCYAQIYFQDPTYDQIQRRCDIFANKLVLEREVVREIQQIMNDTNPYVHTFKTAREQMKEQNIPDITIRLVRGLDMETYTKLYCNHPTTTYRPPSIDEVAAIIPDVLCTNDRRDIWLSTHDEVGIRKINELHGAYDCLAYPLFGNNTGFQPNISLQNTVHGTRHVSIRDFYAFRCHKRDSEEMNPFLLGGQLFHQYLVDQFTKMEHSKLIYIKQHQRQLRTDLYKGFRDQTRNENISNLNNIGSRVILPASFTGSPRYMSQRYQDALTIVQEFGCPTFFITFTTNPHWKEITDIVKLTNQTWQDRPDIVVRIFKAKLDSLKRDLTKNHVLGKNIANIHVVEFQKGGLPHAHIVLIVADEDKIKEAHKIDTVISAELPDPKSQRELYELVTHHNLHGPCGDEKPTAMCMKEGQCCRHFPKMFNPESYFTEDGLPVYKREQNGIIARKGNCLFDNRHVVPYNPYLTKKYDCHINVELCTDAGSIKYMYKYIYKGPDRILLTLENKDECKAFLDSRYVSAPEACWKIFNFSLYDRSHSVVQLPVHLENEQSVFWEHNAPSADEETTSSILNNQRKTKLTAFFKLCQENPEKYQNLLYCDVVKDHYWENSQKTWIIRKRSKPYKRQTLSRMHIVHISQQEQFYLRKLLNTIPGPTSFQSIRNVNSIQCDTYKEACKELGLLTTDEIWDHCLIEATAVCMPEMIRAIFSDILINCDVHDARTLFFNHVNAMSDDFLREYNNTIDSTYTPNSRFIQFLVASDINKHLNISNREWNDFLELKEIIDITLIDLSENDYHDCNIEQFDPVLLRELASTVNQLNHDQKHAFNQIQESLNSSNDETDNQNNIFFIDAPGGYGKTFLLNAIIAHNRLQGKSVFACATTGIASLLLWNARTAHSQFNIPLKIHEKSSCSISKDSPVAEKIKNIDLILWDEAPGSHRFNLEACNRTIQDICDSSAPFADKTVILAGDFRQRLPIIPYATSISQILNSSIKYSKLWSNVKQLRLTKNMRLDEASQKRAQFLLDLGEGKLRTVSSSSNFVELPRDLTLPTSLQDLIDRTFGPINKNTDFSNKIILSPWNKSVQTINDIITDQLPGNGTDCYSIDSAETENSADPIWTDDYLHNITITGMPLHHLKLKPGMIIMVIRNLRPRHGVVNGTRLRITQILRHLIEAVIITGPKKNTTTFIPRIKLLSDLIHDKLPFVLARTQFPVQVAFAMTIDKSQGQTIQHVGIYLPNPVFAHGQLYVALSRCPTFENLNIFLEHSQPEERDTSDKNTSQLCTRNVVYKEIFDNNT